MTLSLSERISVALCAIKVNTLIEDMNDCHDEKGMFCEGGGSGSGAGGSYTPMRVPKGFVSAGTFPMHKIGEPEKATSTESSGSKLSPKVEEAVKIHAQIDATKANIGDIEKIMASDKFANATSEQRAAVRSQKKEYEKKLLTLKKTVDSADMQKTTMVEKVDGKSQWVEYIGRKDKPGHRRTVLGTSIPGKYGPNYA